MDRQISQIVENPYEVNYTTGVPLDGRETAICSTQTNLGGRVNTSIALY